MMNKEQIEFWNSLAGERWTAHQEALDRALDPFGVAVLSRAQIKKGERVVDIGCGCGATTLACADAVGDTGQVTGVDVSAPMLARAKQRAADRKNVSFIQADASAHRFDSPADTIVSRFGVMFFDDPTQAFENLKRALRTGGTIVFACWRAASENPWISVPN